MKGLFFILLGVAWAAAVYWQFGGGSGAASGIGIAVPNGASPWMVKTILLGLVGLFGFGWLIPLGMGIFMVIRGR